MRDNNKIVLRVNKSVDFLLFIYFFMEENINLLLLSAV